MDPKTGKVTTKLVLEDKPRPPSKLSHTVRDAPGNAVAGKLHQEIRKTEDGNVGVESAHKSEEAVETGVHLAREGYRSHKLKPYRKAAQAERKLEKANIEALFQMLNYAEGAKEDGDKDVIDILMEETAARTHLREEYFSDYRRYQLMQVDKTRVLLACRVIINDLLGL